MFHRLCVDSSSRALVSALLCSILGLLTLAACHSFTPTPGATPTHAVITQVVVATRVDTRVDTRVPTPTHTPSNRNAILTSTGKVTQVEADANNSSAMHVRIAPDDPAMRSEFVIGDWNNVTVLFYWAGLETPTPLVSANDKQRIVQNSLGRKVTIGYRAMDPSTIAQDSTDAQEPTVALFSAHKQSGDSQ